MSRNTAIAKALIPSTSNTSGSEVSSSRVISLKTNEKQMFKNLGSVFSDKSKVLSELIQNARRAGAGNISITHISNINGNVADHILTIEDNGKGIVDFQKLLIHSESGWDDATVQAENPFGVGWLSCLFASTEVTIESRGQQCKMVTSEVLEMKPVQVEISNFIGNTRITLRGFALDCSETKKALDVITKGFPVPVEFNGVMLERPHALDNLQNVREFAVGKGTLYGENSSTEFSTHCDLYFQGLPVKSGTETFQYTGPKNIIHLNDSFKVRMPDRDNLLDPAEAMQRIQLAIKKVWAQYLQELKADIPAEQFVNHFKQIQFAGQLELLNDMAWLPRHALIKYSEYPTLSPYPDTSTLESNLHLDDIVQNKQVVVVNLFDAKEDFEYLIKTVSYCKDWVVLNHDLHEDHWIYKHGLDVSKSNIRVDLGVIKADSRFSFDYTEGDIKLVDNFTVHIGDHAILFTDENVAIGDRYENVTLIMTTACPAVIEQICTFTDEWGSYIEDRLDNERMALTNLFNVLSGEKPEVTFQKALIDHYFHYKTNCEDLAVASFIKNRSISCVPLAELLDNFCKSVGVNVETKAMEDFIEKLKPQPFNFN